MKIFIFNVLMGFSIVSLSAQNFCLRFFGNGTGDIDRVKIPIDNPESSADVGESFTIEFQIKAILIENPLGSLAQTGNNDDWTLGHVIVDRDIFGGGDYGDYGIALTNGKIAFGVNNGNQSFTLIGAQPLADNAWHDVAVTRNHITGLMQIYIDGVLDTSAISGVLGNISYRNNRITSWNNDPYIVLGAEKHDFDNTLYPSFSGFLDELRISNVVRYTSNYQPVPVLSDDINTMLLYHFNEGNGNIVNDAALTNGSNSQGTIYPGGNPYGPIWHLRDTLTSSIFTAYSTMHAFNIYPNPFQDFIFFQSNDSHAYFKIIFIDILGRMIMKHTIKHSNNTLLPLDTSELQPGSYTIIITDEEKEVTYIHRVVKW